MIVMWGAFLCDANGNRCNECTNPGRLMHCRCCDHRHTWWMNDRSGDTRHSHGIRKANQSGNLDTCACELRVNPHANRYGVPIGNGQPNSFVGDRRRLATTAAVAT